MRNSEVKTLVKEKLTAEGLNLVKLVCSSGTDELIAIWAGKLLAPWTKSMLVGFCS